MILLTGVIFNMVHRFDKYKPDPNAIEKMIQARKWHEAINDKLKNVGKHPQPLMINAIKEAEKRGLIHQRTVAMAHKIRKEGNIGRHSF